MRAPPPTPSPTHCSPTHYANHPRHGACLSAEDIDAVAAAVMRDGDGGQGGTDPGAKLAALHARLGTRLGDEERWLDAPAVASTPGLRARLLAAFRPEHPASWIKDPRAWLSNFDIDAVMEQYQKAVGPTFRFVGVAPRDFASPAPYAKASCVTEAVCRTHVADLVRDGVKHVGIVFNLDKHTGRGSHWTAMYACVDPDHGRYFGAFYYDSLAPSRMPTEMRALAERLRAETVATYGAERARGFRIERNRVRKQFANTECGIYSIFFLLACARTKRPLEDICKRLVKGDGHMNRLRSILFRPPAGVEHTHFF